MAKSKTKTTALPKNVPFWQNEKILAWLFFAFAFLLYAQTIGFGYALDDVAVIEQNKFVQSGFAGFGNILKTFYWAGFPSYANANSGLFRPLSLILFAIEWKLFPDHPHVYHFVNVVLYATSALLLYKTLRELFRDYSVTIPIGATLLWIIFPTHTEVVANIKSADELLSIIFFLLMMRQLMKWSENKMMKPLLLSGTFFFLSLLSKEGAVLFFPVVFIALYLFRKVEVKQFVRPAILLLAVTAVWLCWHVAVINSAPTKPITYTYLDNSLKSTDNIFLRISTAMLMQGKYLFKSFTGFPLSWDYSYNENPIVGFSNIFVLLSILVCVGLFVIAIQQFRKNPVLSFGILFYFITFALTSNVFILIGATMADRFLFVPSLGLAIALTWVILKLTKGETIKSFHAKAFYILLPLLLFYSIRTFSRSGDWKDEASLYTTDVENAPNSARVHRNYGIILKQQAGKETNVDLKNQLYEQAFQEFKVASEIDSLDYLAYEAAGEVKFMSGDFAQSVYWRTKSLRVEPKNVGLLLDLGNALLKCSKYDSAIVVYKEAIKANCSDSITWLHIGDCYMLKQDTSNAITAFENDVKQYPKYIDGWNKLGNFCGLHKDFKRSNEAFLEITKLNPGDLNAYRMLYTNYKAIGDTANERKYATEFYTHGGK
jgi:tetratricopeptide (TPR) repeat protein